MYRTATLVFSAALLAMPALAMAQQTHHREQEQHPQDTTQQGPNSAATSRNCDAKLVSPQANATGRDRHGASCDQARAAEDCAAAGSTAAAPARGMTTGRDRKSQ